MARVIEVEEEKPKNERLISRGASSGCMLTAAFTVYGFENGVKFVGAYVFVASDTCLELFDDFECRFYPYITCN